MARHGSGYHVRGKSRDIARHLRSERQACAEVEREVDPTRHTAQVWETHRASMGAVER